MEPLNTGNWIEIGKGVATMVVAVIAAFIAYRQVQTARNKLKFDLFDKRMEVYKTISQNVTIIHLMKTITDEQFYALNAACTEARWLFHARILDVIEDISIDNIFVFGACRKLADGSGTPNDERMRDQACARLAKSWSKLQDAAKHDLKLMH